MERISLARIAIIDCEASSLSEQSYPIEIGWCLADSAVVGSTLIVPQPDWCDWDAASEALHGITREELRASGVSVAAAVEVVVAATAGRTLYADGSLDGFWVDRIFAAAAVRTPRIESFDALLDAIVRPEADAGLAPEARDLARAERQGAIIDRAYARAQEIAPKRHRAAADAFHLCITLREALKGAVS